MEGTIPTSHLHQSHRWKVQALEFRGLFWAPWRHHVFPKLASFAPKKKRNYVPLIFLVKISFRIRVFCTLICFNILCFFKQCDFLNECGVCTQMAQCVSMFKHLNVLPNLYTTQPSFLIKLSYTLLQLYYNQAVIFPIFNGSSALLQTFSHALLKLVLYFPFENRCVIWSWCFRKQSIFWDISVIIFNARFIILILLNSFEPLKQEFRIA